MKLDSREIQAVAAAEPVRVDLYASIHKALRAMLTETLLALGRLDMDDAAEIRTVSDRIDAMLDFCASHVRHENDFVHVAIEARATGASAAITHDHEEHMARIGQLKVQLAGLTQTAAGQEAAAAALNLYRDLALFVADNFQHMQVEETAHNAVLWARYTDAELMALHDRLLASIPPQEMMHILRWLVPYLNPTERTALLRDMRAHAPAPVFEATLTLVKPHLTASEWGKLTRSLGLTSDTATV